MPILNLISAVITVVLGVILGAGFISGRSNGDMRSNAKAIGVVPTVAALVTFFLTESFGGPITIADKWTPLMLVYLAANGVVAYATKNAKAKVSK